MLRQISGRSSRYFGLTIRGAHVVHLYVRSSVFSHPKHDNKRKLCPGYIRLCLLIRQNHLWDRERPFVGAEWRASKLVVLWNPHFVNIVQSNLLNKLFCSLLKSFHCRILHQEKCGAKPLRHWERWEMCFFNWKLLGVGGLFIFCCFMSIQTHHKCIVHLPALYNRSTKK